jgi:hypothetical protein
VSRRVRRLRDGERFAKVEPRFHFSQLSALAIIAIAFLGWASIARRFFGPIRSDGVGALEVAAFLLGAFVFCAAESGDFSSYVSASSPTKKLEATRTAVHG